MKLTTTAVSTMSVICNANIAPSTALLLLVILDRTARGLRCYTPDLAAALGRDRNKTLQNIQHLRDTKWISTQPAKTDGHRTLDNRPTAKSLALIQRIQDLRKAIDHHYLIKMEPVGEEAV